MADAKKNNEMIMCRWHMSVCDRYLLQYGGRARRRTSQLIHHAQSIPTYTTRTVTSVLHSPSHCPHATVTRRPVIQ